MTQWRRRDFLSGVAGVAAGVGAWRTPEADSRPVAWLNVRDHGASGDGLTDDSGAIQAAIRAASRDGGVVYFPPGDYALARSIRLTPGVHLQGDGFAGTRLISIRADDLCTVAEPAPGRPLRHCHIRGLGFHGNGRGQGALVHLHGVDGWMEDLSVEACLFIGGRIGLWLRGNPGEAAREGIRRYRVQGCTFSGLKRRGGTALLVGKASAGEIVANRFHDVTAGIQNASSDPSMFWTDSAIVRNSLEAVGYPGVGGYPIHLGPGARSILIEGNTVTGRGGDVPYTDSETGNSFDNIGMDGAEEVRVLGNSARFGGDTGITAQHCRNVIIAGNQSHANRTRGIAVVHTNGALVTSNLTTDNGAGIEGYSRAGILLAHTDAVVEGNASYPLGPASPQDYALTFWDSPDATIGENRLAGTSKGGAYGLRAGSPPRVPERAVRTSSTSSVLSVLGVDSVFLEEGAAAIDELTGGRAGQRVLLTLPPGAVVRHEPDRIVLRGSRSLEATGPVTLLELTHVNGRWIETNRTP